MSFTEKNPSQEQVYIDNETEKRENKNDPVSHPSHYCRGKIEVKDFIMDQKLPWTLGNSVKYICRAGYKDPKKYVEDLQKAIFYLNEEIKQHENN